MPRIFLFAIDFSRVSRPDCDYFSFYAASNKLFVLFVGRVTAPRVHHCWPICSRADVNSWPPELGPSRLSVVSPGLYLELTARCAGGRINRRHYVMAGHVSAVIRWKNGRNETFTRRRRSTQHGRTTNVGMTAGAPSNGRCSTSTAQQLQQP